MGAMAQENGPYLGVSTGFAMYEEETSGGIASDTAAILNASINAGYAFNEFISIEGRLGTGLADGEMTITDGFVEADIDVSLDYLASAFVKFSLPNSSIATPYLLLGGSKGELTAELGGFSESFDESDSSYGVGIDLQMGKHKDASLTVEYISYLDKDGSELNGLNLGVTKRF